MGGDQAASVLASVRLDGIEKRGGQWPASEQEEFMGGIREQYERQGNPYYATARLWDDGVVDPLDTRRVLGLALEVVARGPEPAPESYGVFRM
jgi:3-methylcrotonyl-CoA carboxylase beta subunit